MPTFGSLSASMIASWFSGSPNHPPWLYRPTVQPIFAAASAMGRMIATACIDARRAARHPELRLDLVCGERVEDELRIRIQRRREPHTRQLDVALRQLIQLDGEAR
jgi:hypothetical protein